MTKVKVLLFGELAQLASAKELQLEGYSNIDDINKYLQKTYPKLASKKYAIALNKTIINESLLLNTGDEIALLPPFSGG